MYIILLYVIPLVVLALLCIQLTYTIIYWRRQQKKLIRLSNNQRTDPLELKTFVLDYLNRRGSNKEGNNGTFVLIVIIVTFIVCEAPELANKIMALFVTLSSDFTTRFTPELHQTFPTICDLLMVFDASVNFFWYCTFGRRFRKITKEIFFGKAPAEPQHDNVPLQQY